MREKQTGTGTKSERIRRALACWALAAALIAAACGKANKAPTERIADGGDAGAAGKRTAGDSGKAATGASAASVGGDAAGFGEAAGTAGVGGDAAGATAGGTPEATDLWVRASAGLPPGVITSLEVDPKRPGTVYAASSFGGGIYRTTTAGANWQRTSDGLANGNILDVAVDPFDSNVVFAGSGQGLFRSADQGGRFTNVPLGNGD
ncbi:MAG TPA: hypothetical protein VNG33_20900, partial [Polyangiaceae bacterium]|nr:hypothetical protein [Polyangiaceae bacterium]